MLRAYQGSGPSQGRRDITTGLQKHKVLMMFIPDALGVARKSHMEPNLFATSGARIFPKLGFCTLKRRHQSGMHLNSGKGRQERQGA